MTQEEKDALVEKMARHLYQSKKWDDPKEGPGEKMKEVWRDIARRSLSIAEPIIRKKVLEEAAKKVDTLYPPIHTHASENSERYRTQDETIRVAGRAIRSLKLLESE